MAKTNYVSKHARRHYVLPPTYHLGSAGCGCFLEPPGHPRYFVQSIYTKYGNSPRYGSPVYYLNGTGFYELEQVDKLYGKDGQFPKLPVDHPRTRGWIKTLYSYFRNCYVKEGATSRNVSDDIEICSNQSEDWVKANAHRHDAVLHIKDYYPDYEPEIDMIINPDPHGKGSDGDWWERLAEKPTPEQCPGEPWHKHPVNGNWCQVCGWHGGEHVE